MRAIRTIMAVILVVVMIPTLASAQTLSGIFGGQQPTLALAMEKKAQLIDYTKAKFKDMKTTEWYTENVSILVGLGGIDGYKDGRFAPADPETVAQFVKMLVSALGYNVSQQSGTAWYTPYVDKATSLGWIDKSDSYNYSKPMMRKDLAKMICKSLNLQPDDKVAMPFKDLGGGLDKSWIGTAYKEYLMAGATVNGKDVFTPYNGATRAQASEMIVRALEYKDNPDQFKKDMEAKRKETEKTKVISGFTVPIPDGTNLNTTNGGYSKYGKAYPIICFLLSMTKHKDVFNRERDQLKQVLLQKIDEKTVNDIMTYIAIKKEEGYPLPFKYFYVGEYEIRVGSSLDGYGSYVCVDIYYK